MQDTLFVWAKILPLVIFFPFFIGVAIWAYKPSNRAQFDAYAQIPLQDD